jgi:hypothetical protein
LDFSHLLQGSKRQRHSIAGGFLVLGEIVGLFSKKASSRVEVRTEQLGNVTPDKVRINSKTGKPYPPQMDLTQPGEYGVRVRHNNKFDMALNQITHSSSNVWTGEVEVQQEDSKAGSTLNLFVGDLQIGVVSESTTKSHPALLLGLTNQNRFRASISRENGTFSVRLFMHL